MQFGTKLRIAKERTKALQELKHAFDKYSEIEDERGEAEVLGGIGAVNFDVKDAQNAMSFYNEALVQREEGR